MAGDNIDLYYPLAGLSQEFAIQALPPYKTGSASNVRPVCAIARRRRGGSRPGLRKSFAEQIGATEDPEPPDEFEATFTASKDARLRSDAPTNVAGSSNLILGLRGGGSEVYRCILHFDLSSIPGGATVTAASLVLDLSSALNGHNLAAYVRRLTQTAWVEAEASWNRYATGQSWSTAGGDYTETDEVSWMTASSAVDDEITGLATLVQDALDERSEQLHILLMLQDESAAGGSRSREYFSREDAPDRNAPTLTVTYTV